MSTLQKYFRGGVTSTAVMLFLLSYSSASYHLSSRAEAKAPLFSGEAVPVEAYDSNGKLQKYTQKHVRGEEDSTIERSLPNPNSNATVRAELECNACQAISNTIYDRLTRLSQNAVRKSKYSNVHTHLYESLETVCQDIVQSFGLSVSLGIRRTPPQPGVDVAGRTFISQEEGAVAKGNWMSPMLANMCARIVVDDREEELVMAAVGPAGADEGTFTKKRFQRRTGNKDDGDVVEALTVSRANTPFSRADFSWYVCDSVAAACVLDSTRYRASGEVLLLPVPASDLPSPKEEPERWAGDWQLDDDGEKSDIRTKRRRTKTNKKKPNKSPKKAKRGKMSKTQQREGSADL